MKKINKLLVVSIISFFLMIPFGANNCFAQNPNVKIYEIEEEILEHNQLPLDPYPPFGLLTGYITYPFQFYGSKNFQIDKKKIKVLVAENEYLKIGMVPEYGGRIWFIYDKIRKKEVIHRNYKEAKFYNSGMGYQYLGGGLELNIPNAHSQTNARNRECVMKENPDGSVSLIMSNTEKIGRLHWSVSFTLYPGEARIKQDVRVANETQMEERYLYWANCGIPVNENTEFIYPENSGALHGKYENEISWPIYANKDISILKNIDEAVGYYMLNAREGYMGYYDHDEDFGLVHYADVDDLPGKKYWSWGWHVTAQRAKFTHAEGVNYGEIQSGRIQIQEKFDKIAPMSSISFTHYWYPVGAIGSFNGASENGAINFTIEKKSTDVAVANIKVQVNQKYDKPVFVLKQNGEIIKEIKLSDLSPETPVSLSEEFKLKDIKIKDISLLLVTRNGELISNVLPKAEKPPQYDSYFSAHKSSKNERKDFTAEGLFAKAEVLFNDWFYHLPEIKEILDEVLLVDPGFSRAHTELGLMNLRGGNLNVALDHFNMSLKRIPDDGRTLYYKGLTLKYLGDFSEAKFYLRYSGRFGYEYPERIAEAEIAIISNNLNEAQLHLEKAIELNGTILKGYIYKALVENRLGNIHTSEKMLAKALSLDPENPFISCTNYLIKISDKSISKSIIKRYENYPEELLEVVVNLYSAGFIPEAAQTLKLIQKNNSIIKLYQTELEELTTKKISINKTKSVSADFAWRLEEYFILKRRLKQEPTNAELYYHLGNFYYAHDFEKEGISNWEQAYDLANKDKILLVNLYRANKKIGNTDKAFKYLSEAYNTVENDPYIFEYYVDEIQSRKGIAESIRLMEDNYNRFDRNYSLKTKLMNAYLNNGQYSDLEALLKKSDLHDTHRMSFGNFWQNFKMANGYNNLKEKKYQEALINFENSIKVPENVAQHFMPSFIDQARRYFYMGYCNFKLGNQEKADELWTEALKLKRDSKFQVGYKYYDLKTIYYQAFCLKGLGRYDEAERYIMLLGDYATSTSLEDNPTVQKFLLGLSITGLEDIDNFEKWDSELGLIKINANFNAPEE